MAPPHCCPTNTWHFIIIILLQQPLRGILFAACSECSPHSTSPRICILWNCCSQQDWSLFLALIVSNYGLCCRSAGGKAHWWCNLNCAFINGGFFQQPNEEHFRFPILQWHIYWSYNFLSAYLRIGQQITPSLIIKLQHKIMVRCNCKTVLSLSKELIMLLDYPIFNYKVSKSVSRDIAECFQLVSSDAKAMDYLSQQRFQRRVEFLLSAAL